MEESNSVVLSLEKVTKRFGGVVADDDVSFELRAGQVHGLIGPNGSGKTTTLNLISGIYDVDAGSIVLAGEDITRTSTYHRARGGIARSFQAPRLLSRCDIRTNILLGGDLAKRRSLREKGTGRLDSLLEVAAISVPLNSSVSELSYGQQKLLEIVRAMLSRPKVLLLDEPAAGLNHAEMNHVVGLIDVAVKEGTSVLLIEHSMDLVMSLCETITVLNFGKVIGEGTAAQIQSNQAVIEAYIGRKKH